MKRKPRLKIILTYEWTGGLYPNQLTTDDFVSEAIAKHRLRYDYSKSEYVNCRTPVIITCREHGDFSQFPASHIKGSNCPVCSGNKKGSTVEFIKKACAVHGDKYDYSLVDYVTATAKVKIICLEHGLIEQQPRHHLKGHGCHFCAVARRSNSQDA